MGNAKPDFTRSKKEFRALNDWAGKNGLRVAAEHANLTLAVTLGPVARKIYTPTGKENLGGIKTLRLLPLCVPDIASMARLLRKLRPMRHALLIMERPATGKPLDKVLRREDKFFDLDHGRSWLFLDVDKMQPPSDIDPASPAAIEWFRQTLPPELADYAFAATFTSSAGLSQELKLRAAFLLDRPVATDKLKRWAEAQSKAEGAFNADLYVFSKKHLHLTSDPAFIDRPDPFSGRSRVHVIDGERAAVSADALERVVKRADVSATVDAGAFVTGNEQRPRLAGDALDLICDQSLGGLGLHEGLLKATWNLVSQHGGLLSERAKKRIAKRAWDAAWKAFRDGRMGSRDAEYIKKTAPLSAVEKMVNGAVENGAALRIPPKAPGSFYDARRKLRGLTSSKGRAKAENGYGLQDYALVAAARARARLGVEFSAEVLIDLLRDDMGGREPHAHICDLIRKHVKDVQQQQRDHTGFAGLNEPVIQIDDLHEAEFEPEGLTIVRAPFGTGKTEKLGKRFLRRYPGAGYMVCRRSLTRDAAAPERLDMAYYRNPDAVARAARDGTSVAGVVNTVAKPGPVQDATAQAPGFIFDESEQFIRHLAGDALPPREKAPAFAWVRDTLATVPTLLLDAGMNTFSVEAYKFLAPDRPLRIYELAKQREGRVLLLLPCSQKYAAAALTKEVTASLEEGQRALVATDLKAAAKALDKHLREQGFHGRLITADTPGKEREAFFQDPNKLPESEGLDYLIFSPAISSGVSITSDYFQRVFGLYTGVVTPADFAQMLFRHRRAKEWTLAISAKAPGQGYSAAENRAALEALDQQQHGDDKRQLDDVSVFVNAVQAREREDKAWYALKLLTLLEDLGLTIERERVDGEALEAEAAELKDARAAIKKAGAEAILNARQLDEVEAGQLRQRDDLLQEDLDALSRYRICEVLALPNPDNLTADDLAFVDRHKKPSQVIGRFDVMRRFVYDLNEHDIDQPAATRAFLAFCRAFFRDALEGLGVDLVDGSGTWTKQDAAVMLPEVFEAHGAVVTKLGLRLASTETTRTVASILERIGLRAESVGAQRSGVYQIRAEDWARLLLYAAGRAGKHGTPGDLARRAFWGMVMDEDDPFRQDPANGDPIPDWLSEWLEKDGAVLLLTNEIAQRTGCARKTAQKRKREAAAVNNRQLHRFGVVATGGGRNQQTEVTALSFQPDAEFVREQIEFVTGRKVGAIFQGDTQRQLGVGSLKEQTDELSQGIPLFSSSMPSNPSEQNDGPTTPEPSAVEPAGPRPETSRGRQPGETNDTAPVRSLASLLRGGGLSGGKASRLARRGEKHRRRMLKDRNAPDRVRQWLKPGDPEHRRLIDIALGASDGDIPAAGRWISDLMEAS